MLVSNQVDVVIRDFRREEAATISDIAHENFNTLSEENGYSPQHIDYLKERW